jgi:hypothetical protein
MKILKLVFLLPLFMIRASLGEIVDNFPATLICTSQFNSVCITGCDDQKVISHSSL